MLKSIIIISLLIFNIAFGQKKKDRTEFLISEFKSELNEKGISDFFVIKQITYGIANIYNLNDPNSCDPNGVFFTMYAFWENGKNSYVKKFDNCGGFNALKIIDSKPVKLYRKNIKKLKSEKVKMYQLTPDSIGNDRLVYKTVSSKTHQPQRYFWFFTKSDEFTNHFDTYNLTTDEQAPNLNYKHNNELFIVKLNAICSEIIDAFSEKKMFNRMQ